LKPSLWKIVFLAVLSSLFKFAMAVTDGSAAAAVVRAAIGNLIVSLLVISGKLVVFSCRLPPMMPNLSNMVGLRQLLSPHEQIEQKVNG